MAKRTVNEKFHFKIEGFTPETLPMSRLALYLSDLAELLGHENKVHFVKVAKGSADLVHVVDEELQAEVIERVHLVKQGLGPVDAQVAFRNLNTKLSEDGKTAKITRGRNNLLAFPGASALPQTIGPIYLHGHLDGQLIRVGGKDGTKPIHIMTENAYYICNANAEVARQLAPAYEKYIRVFGNGKWFRQTDGEWILDHFTIKSFEFLEDEKLLKVVAKLRAIPDNEWANVDDPLEELALIRGKEAAS
jgi:hypothetical protein